MHGEEKEEEGEEEEDTRKCIRFESYSQHGIGFSFASRCWKLEGGTNWRGVAWLAGWPFARCFGLHSAGCAYLAAQHGAKLHCNIAIKAAARGGGGGGGWRSTRSEEDEGRREPVRKKKRGEEKGKKKRKRGGKEEKVGGEGKIWRGPKGYSS